MIVLGLNAFGHNPSACLLRDGVLTSFCQEDRFTGLKGSFGMFPSSAVAWCLKSQRLSLTDIDRIAFSWGCRKYPAKMLFHLAKVGAKLFGKRGSWRQLATKYNGNLSSTLKYLYLYTPNAVRTNIRDCLRASGHKGPIPEIEFVEHHLSHAYQAYYQSPYKKASILVADGSGEENCISGYAMRDGKLVKVFGYDVPISLGWFYGGFTAYLGFQANRDEGKLMGLAALGQERKESNPWLERMDKILRVTDDGLEMNPIFFKFGGNQYHSKFTDRLVEFITSFDPDLLPVAIDEMVEKDGLVINKYLLEGYLDLAYAVQSRLEKTVAHLVSRLVASTRIKDICLAGGVFMNCKVNGYILDHCGIENIFIHPAASDDGACIGAAFYVAENLGDNPRNVLTTPFLGPSFTNDEVEKLLRTSRISYSRPDDICSVAAELISQGKIIGWFNGGLEIGARALGGRSIIALPDNPRLKEKINANIKFREPWRPYCPSITAESKDLYLEKPVDAPFMILSRAASRKLINEAPATVHVDGTVRPQTVSKEILPKWHWLLENVRQCTGNPVVLNTSFNVRGAPIVCTPSDAVKCFYSTGLDALVLEDILIEK